MKTLTFILAFGLASGVVSSTLVHAQNASTQAVTPSLQNYQKWMAEGRKLKAEVEKAYSRFPASQAADAFRKAANFAPTSSQRADAQVEGGEVLSMMAEMPQAIVAFQNALEQKISPEMKGRALLGIANSEFHVAFMTKTLVKYADRLRSNYDAAVKARKLTPDEAFDVWKNLAEISLAQGKSLQAAREYLNVAEVAQTSSGKEYFVGQSSAELKKLTTLSQAEQSEAVKTTDSLFGILLPIKQKQDSASMAQARMDYAALLAQFGQNARAETMWNDVSNDETFSQGYRADAIIQIAKSQTAQRKYDLALQTLDRLPKLSSELEIRQLFERAQVYMAQGKWSLASLEYMKVTLKDPTADEKAQAFLGTADAAGKEVEELRQKKAPETEVKSKLEDQKRSLLIAQFQSQAKPELIREARLRLAEWEKANGSAEEAKKWEDKARISSFNK